MGIRFDLNELAADTTQKAANTRCVALIAIENSTRRCWRIRVRSVFSAKLREVVDDPIKRDHHRDAELPHFHPFFIPLI